MIADKRVLITGGYGFLGKHLQEALKPYGPSSIATFHKAQCDLTHAVNVNWLLKDVKPDVIIHLAVLVGGIGANRENPGKFFYENAMMGLNVMEQARLCGVAKFVNIGTICSYPKHTPVPFKEEDFWNGYPEETNAPYGIAKKAIMVMGQAYRQQYGMNIIPLLPVNMYGPGDNFNPATSHVIPAIIRKVLEARDSGKKFVEAWGTGSASREFLFVRDAAKGIAQAVEAYDGAEPINLGSGVEITIEDLTEVICELCWYSGELRWDHTKPDGQPRRLLDSSKVNAAFGFKSTTGFVEGLRETIDWYVERRQHEQGRGGI